jgi:hypothetical protein
MPITVHYDPANPKRATLHTGWRVQNIWFCLIALGIGLIFVSAG